MTFPNLFIVGAAKAGTSYLWDNLKNHPEIFMPVEEKLKEPAYFSSMYGWQDKEQYLKLFPTDENTDYKYMGEASTSYLTDPEAFQNIYNFNPESKIIISLRNPAKRAYSLYNWMVQDGYENAPTFRKAIQLEEQRIKTGKYPLKYYPYNYQYFNSGLYYQQVRKYKDLFGDNVLVLLFEEMVSDPQKTVDGICSFLDLPAMKVNKIPVNPSYRVFDARLQFRLRKLTGKWIAKGWIKNTSVRKRDVLMRKGMRRGKPKPIPDDLYSELMSRAEVDIQKLSQILPKTDFSIWFK